MTPDDSVPEEHVLGQFIPLHYHGHMLRDEARMRPFKDAIERVVPVGGNVVELGGGTGVLSWFAAQRARKVWCVERNPALARAARSILSENVDGDRVEVVLADAMTWLPPEPVDVVICEMLHVAQVREKQFQVLQSFRERYQAAFGPRLPAVIPSATLLATQPIEQNFEFHGYTARVPVFEAPGPQMAERVLAESYVYQIVDYSGDIPSMIDVEFTSTMQRAGTFNALSFLSNHFTVVLPPGVPSPQWLMNQMILPLPRPISVTEGEQVVVRFAYQPGGSIESLQVSLDVEPVSRRMLSPLTITHRRAA